MLLRHGRTGSTGRDAQNTSRLACPSALTMRARSVVDGVLEYTRYRTVVFGCNEQNALGVLDFVLQSLDGLGLVRVIVLIVWRQVTDLHLLERKLRRRQLYNGISKFAIE